MTHADEYFYDETIAYIFFAFMSYHFSLTVCYDLQSFWKSSL